MKDTKENKNIERFGKLIENFQILCLFVMKDAKEKKKLTYLL